MFWAPNAPLFATGTPNYSPGGLGSLFSKLFNETNKKVNIRLVDSTSIYKLKPVNDYALFILPSVYRKFTTDEIANLKNYLNTGGIVVCVAEHDNFYRSSEVFNTLTKPYGIEILLTILPTPEGDYTKAWPLANSAIYKLDSIKMYYPAHLKVTAPARVLATANKATVCADVKVGKGRLVVLGDFEMLWDMTNKEGIEFGNNYNFITNLLGIKTNIDYNESVSGIEESGYFTQNQLFNLNEREIYSWEYTDIASSIKEMNTRFVIKTFTKFNYFNYLEKTNLNAVLKLWQYKPTEPAINTLLAKYGFKTNQSQTVDTTLVYTYTGEHDAYRQDWKATPEVYTAAKAFTFPTITVTDSSLAKGFTIVYAVPNAVELDYWLPFTSDPTRPFTTKPVYEGTPLKNAIVAMYNDEVFIYPEILDEYPNGNPAYQAMRTTILDARKKWEAALKDK